VGPLRPVRHSLALLFVNVPVAVVGDRRLLRFLRGKQNDVNEAAKMFSAFLKWRDENNVDDIRNQILYGGLDTPYKFPNGKKIIDLAPQIIVSAKAQDYKGQPLGELSFSEIACPRAFSHLLSTPLPPSRLPSSAGAVFI
jgi:hypothetical protein